MKKLERLIEAKDKEIKKLESKVLELESKELFEHTDSELESDIEESVPGAEDELIFSFESCDFTTIYRDGLKGHMTKKHVNACQIYGSDFESKDSFERHAKMERYLSHIKRRSKR